MEGYQDFNITVKTKKSVITKQGIAVNQCKLFHISCSQQCVYFNHATAKKASMLVLASTLTTSAKQSMIICAYCT